MKSNLVEKYLGEARNGIGANFNNAGGNFRNATGGQISAMKAGNSQWAGATGAPMNGAAMPTSQPYILQISNASAGAVANFDIFGANQYLYGGYGTFSTGTWTYQNVTVSSFIANTTYQQLLSQSKDQPFVIAQTSLQVISGSNSVLTQPATFTVTNQDGTSYSQPLIFQYNEFQNITTKVSNYTQFVINGNSKLTFSSIAGLSVLQVLLYPATVLDTTAALYGGSVAQSYGNPKTNQQSVIIK